MGIYSLIEKKKREKNKKENVKLAKIATITAVVGASVGTTAGVLLAPKSGKETRADIVEKSKLAKEEIRTKSKSLKENLDSKVVKGKNNISEAKSKISQYLSSKKNTETETFGEVDSNIKSEVVDTEETVDTISDDLTV